VVFTIDQGECASLPGAPIEKKSDDEQRHNLVVNEQNYPVMNVRWIHQDF
jgi:hypothetical protein